MPMPKLRPILFGTLIGVLCVYASSLFWDKVTLQKKQRNLLEESHQLQITLDQVQQKYGTLLKNLKTSEKEAQNMEQAIESLKKENESVQFSLKKVQAHLDSILEEKSYLEEMLINKSKQIEILNSRKGSSETTDTSVPASTVESMPASSVTGEAEPKNDELKRLNDQNRVLQEKLDRLYKTTNAKINEINIAKIALEETVSTAKKKIEDEWNTVDLGSVTTSAVPDRPSDDSQPKKPKSEGHVLAINNEHGFVVVDLGKVDNLPSDAMLQVQKNGQTIATLSVLEIRDVMAACNIKDLQNGQRIEINDRVSVLH